MKNPKFQSQPSLQYDIDQLYDGILQGDRLSLSRAITLVESRNEHHMDLAATLLEKCLGHSGKSYRIGITGSPGVGKSTFIENWGLWLIDHGYNPAVLAVDPSSTISKGSLLGDKTRMEQLSKSEKGYIRPSPAMETLGGVTHATKESIILCEAAGFNPIIIETVGVGQSETLVRQMVDFFLLLIPPGAGDDLQGIKRGIVELADLVCINKADGDRLKQARQTKSDFQRALHLFNRGANAWEPDVIKCSAIKGAGLDSIWATVEEYFDFMGKDDRLTALRQKQNHFWLDFQFRKSIERLIKNNKVLSKLLSSEKRALDSGEQTITGAMIKLKRELEKHFNAKP